MWLLLILFLLSPWLFGLYGTIICGVLLILCAIGSANQEQERRERER